MSKARQLAELGNAFDDGALSNRNLIINGAMQVAQRGTSGTFSTTNNYLVDRFAGSRLGGLADIFDSSQVSDAPEGFSKSYKITQDGTSVTLSGTMAAMIGYRPEGQDYAHLDWGTSNAKTITVSFYVKSSITGTFAFTIASNNSDQDIAKEYTISTANTWEKKELIIPGPTSGTWGTGTDVFGYIIWGIAGVLGSARETSNIDSWGAGSGGSSVTVTANSTNAVATTSGATFQITGVQLEVGDTATPFEHRSYGQELQLCKRYYQKYIFDDNIPVVNVVNWDGNQVYGVFPFDVEMRGVPTPDKSAASTFNVLQAGTVHNPTNIVIQNESKHNAEFVASGISDTQGQAAWVRGDGVSEVFISFDAEL